VGAAVSKILESLKISKPSKSTTEAIFKVSKALIKDLKKKYKKEIKKASAK
jgi:hypothetical protein